MVERNPPSKWKVEKFAEVGVSEPFVSEFLELYDILGGTMIPDTEKVNVKDAIGTVLFDGLIPAFLELRNIRASVGQDLPLVDRYQLYEDFARKVWKSHKDLTQRAGKAMGFNIGFLYQEEQGFEEGLKKFRVDWPGVQGEFEHFVRENRSKWQSELRAFRNGFLEHQQGDRMEFRKFYDASFVETLFNMVWGAIVDLLVILMSLKLPPRVHIVVNDEKIHGPWPNRFRWIIEGP